MSYRVDSLNASSSRPICRYFVNGYCIRGPSCHYLHIRESSNSYSSGQNNDYSSNINGESSSSTLHKSNSNSNHRRSNNGSNSGGSIPTNHNFTNGTSEVCKYFLEDRCRFGDSCWYKHERPENDTNGINPTDSQKNDSKNQKDKQKAKEIEEEYICSICYESPKLFGLLVHCDHVFCRDCIKEWRKTSNVSSPFQDTDTTKTCPVCRKNSPYFVPSLHFTKSGPQKEQIITTYREKISQIPCRYFEKSGKCPFADECFYRHANPDGSRCVLGPPRKRKPRFLSSNIRYEEFDIAALTEIMDGLHFNFAEWSDDIVDSSWDDGVVEGSWADEDDDDENAASEIAHYFASHHLSSHSHHLTTMEVVANDDDDDNVAEWGHHWASSPSGWDDGW
jgi:hypothetical protein